MAKINVYRVVFYFDNANDDEYIYALSAQDAADEARRRHTDLDGLEIVEISRVVNNWR